MPTLKRSALNPGGSWETDGQDQADIFNAQRRDQLNAQAYNRQQDQGNNDWRTQYALAQLGLQGEQMRGSREDSALARQAQADALKQQFAYMGQKDVGDNEYRNKALDIQGTGYKTQNDIALQQLGLQKEMAARNTQEYNDNAGMRKTKNDIALAQLKEIQDREARMTGAGATSFYAPQTDVGKDAQTQQLATGATPAAASFAAKQADQARTLEEAQGAEAGLVTKLKDFYAKDNSYVGWNPSPEESASITNDLQALTRLYQRSGMAPGLIKSKIADLVRNNLTSGGKHGWATGPSQDIITQFGGTFQ